MQAWSPYLAKDIECLERIQRRVTKMVRGLNNMNYQERLKAVRLQSLQQRRRKGDLIETFKILKGVQITEQNLFFPFGPLQQELRGQSLKLYKKRSRTHLRSIFSAIEWLMIGTVCTARIVDSENVDMFKRRLDKNWQDMGV